MDRRVARATIVLAFAICTLAYAAPAGQARASKRPQLTPTLMDGVNIASVEYGSVPAEADSEIAQAKALHAKLVRIDVPWSVLEPAGPEQLNAGPLAFTDRLIGDAAAAGIRVIVSADSTPCWASSAPSQTLAGCNPLFGSDANAWAPRNPSEYAAYVAFLTRRYGERLAAIEVWNEPDQANEDYLAGPNKATTYAALLRAAYPAVKAVDPALPVLAGSLVGTNGQFLRLLYAAGIKGYYDGLAVHFYTLTLAALRNTHEVQLANGDETPMWLDEFGWSSCLPEAIQQEQACVTPQIQATNVTNTLRALSRTPWVKAAVVYKLQDSTSQNFGLLSTSGASKPAFSAFASALASPLGSVSRPTLKLVRKGPHVIASGSGPVGDYMELEAFKGSTLRYRVLFALNRYNDYSIALPSALGTHGLRVRVFQYWSGSATAVQRKI